MDLYLVRHAVAHKRDASRWPDDAERPLTPEGEEKFREVARALGRIAPRVEFVFSSPFARAWRTAEILAEQTSWPAPIPLPELEPGLPPHKAALALERYENLGTVAVVGHRPQLHELAAYLLTGSGDGLDISIKKGGAALLRFDGTIEDGAGTLRWSLPPKLLTRIAAQAT